MKRGEHYSRPQRQRSASGGGSGYTAAAQTTDAYTYNTSGGQKNAETLQLAAVGTAGPLLASYTYTADGRLAPPIAESPPAGTDSMNGRTGSTAPGIVSGGIGTDSTGIPTAVGTGVKVEPDDVRPGSSLSSSLPSAIDVRFQLDPEFSQSRYVGALWVAPPTFYATALVGERFTVEVQVRGVSPTGRFVPISPSWSTEDTGVVTVSPSRGDEVTLDIHGVGTGLVRVATMDISKELFVKAEYYADGAALKVEISH